VGIVAFDTSHRITQFVEKPHPDRAVSRWGNSGVYVCSRHVLDWAAERPEVPLDFGKDLFPAMLAAGALLRARPTSGVVIDFGSPSGLDRAEAAVRAGLLPAPRAVALQGGGLGPC
jgi:NDP-sugar pyrophosphorylase family protein